MHIASCLLFSLFILSPEESEGLTSVLHVIKIGKIIRNLVYKALHAWIGSIITIELIAQVY